MIHAVAMYDWKISNRRMLGPWQEHLIKREAVAYMLHGVRSLYTLYFFEKYSLNDVEYTVDASPGICNTDDGYLFRVIITGYLTQEQYEYWIECKMRYAS